MPRAGSPILPVPWQAGQAGNAEAIGVFHTCESKPSRKGVQDMKSTFNTVCYAVALAMGVAVIVLNIINPLPAGTTSSLLALGLFAVGLAGLR